jgi:hypothetical protein
MADTPVATPIVMDMIAEEKAEFGKAAATREAIYHCVDDSRAAGSGK